MELYYEQNVVNNNIDERAKKTKTLSIAKTACIVIAIFVLMTGMIFVNDSSFGLIFAILAVVDIPFIVIAVILGHFNKKNNTEYDYVLDDENLKISEIYFRQTRKLKYTIRLRTVESVGMFNSEGYSKAEVNAQKKHIALVNFEDENRVIYILYNTEKGRQIIFVEPDRGFMISLRRVVSAITVFDKSIKDFEHLLESETSESEEE